MKRCSFLILSLYQIHPIIKTSECIPVRKRKTKVEGKGGRRMQVTLVGFDLIFRFVFFLNEDLPDSKY